MSVDPLTLWRERIQLPTYAVSEAARYTSVTTPISTRTIQRWFQGGDDARLMTVPKPSHSPLSYLHLIEVAVVAMFRRAGISLPVIRRARDFLTQKMAVEYPFAQIKLETDGKRLFMEDPFFDALGIRKKVIVDRNGQYVWTEIIGDSLKLFDYAEDLVITWRVGGFGSPVTIDPRICFGSPAVKGIPTRTLSHRYAHGQSLEELAYDYYLDEQEVIDAILFEHRMLA